jgi:GlpG protein
MRTVGHLQSEAHARRLGDYLLVHGIENLVEFDNDAGWAVWIVDEDKLEVASDFFREFSAGPEDARFRGQSKAAAEVRDRKEKEEGAYRKRIRERRHLFRPLTSYQFGLITFAMIVASVLVFFLTGFGYQSEKMMFLRITDYEIDGSMVSWLPGLPEVRRGELWRLVTPIFIHFGPLHLIFNLLWLKDLGSMLEERQGKLFFAVFVLAVAAASNVAQFYVGRSPLFGGMSGVVYGLMGFIWLRGKFDPGSGLFLHPTIVTMMIVWFVLGYTGILGPIANTAHAAGLVLGLAWGYLSSLRYR